MDEEKMDVRSDTQGFAAPILPENGGNLDADFAPKLPFAASGREMALAFFMYLPAYLYLQSAAWCFPVFCALFCAMAEWFYRGTPRADESWFWLGCLAVTALAATFGENRVWEGYTPLFTHAFAVYYVLCRSGRLLEGESGHLLPLDALFGLIVFPFKHLFLRIRTVSFALTHRKTGEETHPAAWAAMAVGALLALGLLALAVRELSGADAAFDAWTQKLLGVFQWRLNEQTLWNVLLSLPVGAYLFGLIAGTGREKIEAVRARGERVNAALGSLRKVPVAVWTAALGVFAALYLAFFSLQAGYLFGAFVKMIPDGYTIAEYARQGFFSLCRVMAVNFALLWLVTRACVKPVRQEKTLLLLCAGAAVPESGVCCHRGVQAVSVHQQLRLHTPAVAVCVADCRTRCGDWLRALFARDRKESGPVLDAVFRRDADAAELVLSRSRPKNIFEIPLTEPAVYAIITKLNRASISRDRAVR